MIERGNGPAPKSGRNSTGTYGGQLWLGSPFPAQARLMPATSGGYGRTYQSMTASAIPPMETYRDTATQTIPPAAQPGSLFPTQKRHHVNIPVTNPNEHGRFFGQRQTHLQKRTGGVSCDPNRDTLQHPNPKHWKAPKKHQGYAIAGERTSAASFGSEITLTGNAANGTTLVGRWSQVKRGAAG